MEERTMMVTAKPMTGIGALHQEVATMGDDEGFECFVGHTFGLGGVSIFVRATKDGKTIREIIDLKEFFQIWAGQLHDELEAMRDA